MEGDRDLYICLIVMLYVIGPDQYQSAVYISHSMLSCIDIDLLLLYIVTDID